MIHDIFWKSNYKIKFSSDLIEVYCPVNIIQPSGPVEVGHLT